jgi:hypothetical protein
MPVVSFETLIPGSNWLLQPGTVVTAAGYRKLSPGRNPKRRGSRYKRPALAVMKETGKQGPQVHEAPEGFLHYLRLRAWPKVSRYRAHAPRALALRV